MRNDDDGMSSMVTLAYYRRLFMLVLTQRSLSLSIFVPFFPVRSAIHFEFGRIRHSTQNKKCTQHTMPISYLVAYSLAFFSSSAALNLAGTCTCTGGPCAGINVCDAEGVTKSGSEDAKGT